MAAEQTGKRISLSSMSRVLGRIDARRGRPKPVVVCPLSARQKRRRLRHIRELLEHLPPDEVAVYEDEADVHLNPKIGLDWMNRGQQKLVVTPGVNQKAYLAGALDARDGTLTWVGAPWKNSTLFVQLLEKLCQRYPDARRIHVILDNYGIHHSHEARRALQQLSRIQLHFLPPYCPDHNRIERLWENLHANVTRNHRHSNLLDLCAEVAYWLDFCLALAFATAGRRSANRLRRYRTGDCSVGLHSAPVLRPADLTPPSRARCSLEPRGPRGQTLTTPCEALAASRLSRAREPGRRAREPTHRIDGASSWRASPVPPTT